MKFQTQTNFSYIDSNAFNFVVTWEFESSSSSSDSSSSKIVEEFESVEIDTSELPPNTQITKESTKLTLTNTNPGFADEFSLTKDYVSHRLIISSDMYADIDNLTPCTKKDITNSQMHYTGKSWPYRGLIAYNADGFSLKFNFEVLVKYKRSVDGKYDVDTQNKTKIYEKSQVFSIECKSNADYTQFIKLYKSICIPKEQALRLKLLNV